MKTTFVITDYIDNAMDEAFFDKLEDDSFAGKIPSCKGVIAFSKTLKECKMNYVRF